MSQKTALSIDIGGTKIAYGIVDLESFTLLFSDQIPFEKGKARLLESISTIAQIATLQRQENNWPPFSEVGIGIPGKLVGPQKSIIQKGSGIQLGTTKDEFAGTNLQQFFRPIFPESIPLKIINDAVAQMIGGVHQLLNTGVDLSNQHIGYIGPGTGLGGGFAYIDPKGSPHPYSDGHIFDIMIPTNGHTRSAEDLISSKTFVEQTNHTAKDINLSLSLLDTYANTIQEVGLNLGRLIEILCAGTCQKSDSVHTWPKDDTMKIQQTTHFLIGGSIGTTPPLSDLLLESAKTYLKQIQANVTLVQIPDPASAALLGPLYTVDNTA